MTRANWGSRLGFILASAGSAVGLGSIWKFPYVVAQNGGGAFLLIFTALAFTFGLALVKIEMSFGRAGKTGIFGSFRKLGGKHWLIVGILPIIISFLIMAFYNVVGGWTIAYIFKELAGSLNTTNTKILSTAFNDFIANPMQSIFYYGLFILMTMICVLGGIQKGIETLSKYLMPLLFILMLILIARGLTLPGAWEGVKFLFKPDLSKINFDVVTAALGLVFFSLSLGMGAMVTYGSYLSEDINLPNAALWVVTLALISCLLGGLMVLPPTFVFGMTQTAGPGLIFISMPAVFTHILFGQVFGVLFFILLMIAALTSAVSLAEVIVSFLIDEMHISRTKAAASYSLAIFLVGIPCALSFGSLADVTVFRKNIFALFDYATSNLLLPISGVLTSIFCGWFIWQEIETQMSSKGRHTLHAVQLTKLLIAWVAPVAITLILISNL